MKNNMTGPDKEEEREKSLGQGDGLVHISLCLAPSPFEC